SGLTGVPTRSDVAMTGESTLRGTVLPIGGLNEKAVAARRAGIRTILIPQGNTKDLSEVPEEIREALEFVPIENMDRVLELALEQVPKPERTVPPPVDPDEQSQTYAH